MIVYSYSIVFNYERKSKYNINVFFFSIRVWYSPQGSFQRLFYRISKKKIKSAYRFFYCFATYMHKGQEVLVILT